MGCAKSPCPLDCLSRGIGKATLYSTSAVLHQPVHVCAVSQHTFKEGFSAASRSSLRLTGAATLVRFSPPPDGRAAGFCAVSPFSSATQQRGTYD